MHVMTITRRTALLGVAGGMVGLPVITAVPLNQLMRQIRYEGHWYHDPVARCFVTYADGSVDVLSPPHPTRRFDKQHYRIWRDMIGFWHEANPSENVYAQYPLSPYHPLSLSSPEFVRLGMEDGSIWQKPSAIPDSG